VEKVVRAAGELAKDENVSILPISLCGSSVNRRLTEHEVSLYVVLIKQEAWLRSVPGLAAVEAARVAAEGVAAPPPGVDMEEDTLVAAALVAAEGVAAPPPSVDMEEDEGGQVEGGDWNTFKKIEKAKVTAQLPLLNFLHSGTLRLPSPDGKKWLTHTFSQQLPGSPAEAFLTESGYMTSAPPCPLRGSLSDLHVTAALVRSSTFVAEILGRYAIRLTER
jgi:hypothetical protein